MTYDVCDYCEGTGKRDFLSGAPCRECDGTGLVQIGADPDDDDSRAALADKDKGV